MITDNTFSSTDTLMMRRALQLARAGLGNASPNPMVGAVITAPDGRIIGEGYHRRCGGPHAEVNAVRSVSAPDRQLLTSSTIYVTLEPCAHYGKTPPCARLITDTGIPEVVVGAIDPFAKVAGRGVEILTQAGCKVRTGLLVDECRSLNARFFTAHTHHRPFVTLKWATTADGFMDIRRDDGQGALRISTRTGQTLVHRLRANHDAILVGSGTVIADAPRLDVRLWHGKSPVKAIIDRRGRLGTPTGEYSDVLARLYDEQGVTSVLVEGGPTLLRSILDCGLWDLARVETSPQPAGKLGMAPAPTIRTTPLQTRRVGDNRVDYYSNNPLVGRYFIDNGL